jgi:hypothetical protein
VPHVYVESIHEFNMNRQLVLLIAHSTNVAFRGSFDEYSEVGNFLNDPLQLDWSLLVGRVLLNWEEGSI